MQVTRRFDSMAELVDYCAGDAQGYRRSRAQGERSWFGTASFSEAQSIAFNWKDGAERIERIRARVALKNQRTRKSVRMREAGPGVVSMGHYMAGHPQPYATLEDDSRTAKGKGKVVKILVNVCASAGVDADTIEQRGAAVLALVAALEQAGKRVEIQVGMANGGNRSAHYMDARVTVKRANQKLNLNSVAFALAHPSMLRRFFFSVMEREDNAKTRKAFKIGNTYGSVIEFRDHGADLYFGGAHLYNPAWSSPEKTQAWIAETLESQGIQVKR